MIYDKTEMLVTIKNAETEIGIKKFAQIEIWHSLSSINKAWFGLSAVKFQVHW